MAATRRPSDASSSPRPTAQACATSRPQGSRTSRARLVSGRRRIAISAIGENDLDGEIFILADGRMIRQATNNHLSDRHPTWSPDGRRLAFASTRTGLRQIYGMRADGTRQRRLSHQGEDCEDPAWSPHGGWIVFTCQLQYWSSFGCARTARASGCCSRAIL